MKKIMFLVALAVMMIGFTASADAAVRVRGYFRSNGTYVQPYYRSNADSFRSNNYSSYGNYNPYTGKVGYKRY